MKISFWLQNLVKRKISLPINNFERGSLKLLSSRFVSRIPHIPPFDPQNLFLCLAATTALYAFGIGRPRFESSSAFVVRQPMLPSSSSTVVAGPLLGGPTMFASLEDGRYLAVYLTSPEVMKRSFNRFYIDGKYKKKFPDPYAGIANGENREAKLAFFRRQISVQPDPLTGVIYLKTTGLDPDTPCRLNKILLSMAQDFVNQMNQDIGFSQFQYAQRQVLLARQRLNKSTEALKQLKASVGLVDPVLESSSTSALISSLEAKLVDLKAQEATLRQQFKDPHAPEVESVADQVRELNKQIQIERGSTVNPLGRNIPGNAAEATKLQDEVAFATETLNAAMLAAENSRMESQRQQKFLILLSQPQTPQVQDWNWRWKVFAAFLGIYFSTWSVANFILGLKNRF